MVISKLSIARALAVIIISVTLMSAVPAQAGVAEVAQKFKSGLYGAGRVACLAVNSLFMCFGVQAIIYPNAKLGRDSGLIILCCTIPTIITLCKSLKNGDKEVIEQDVVEVAKAS